jgi:putative zinc finger/helix-turn-helix YgiT family protein
MKKTINSPYANGKAILKQKNTVEEFRNENFDVLHFYYECEKTKKQFVTTEAGDLNMNQIYYQYRERKGILSPEQIKKLRENYGLSSSKMSRLLGFGPNTYTNYEKGEIPTEANAEIIKIAQEPDDLLKHFLTSKDYLFSKKQFDNLISKLKTIKEQKDSFQNWFKDIKGLWDAYSVPNSYTGYRASYFRKFTNMVIYFANKENDFNRSYASRINKLLFYSDYLNFRNTYNSISGCNYHANTFGTVPIRADISYFLMELFNYIKKEPVYIDNQGEIKSKIVPIKEFEENLFTKSEIEIMDYVFKTFKKFTTKELIDINHEEDAWKELNGEKKRISYKEYAFKIKAV